VLESFETIVVWNYGVKTFHIHGEQENWASFDE
jgi:hypothetical protein